MAVYSNSLKQTSEASYKVMKMTVETKEPHIIAETLVIPAIIVISEIMFSEKKSSKLKISHIGTT